jgi:hypothetical protein
MDEAPAATADTAVLFRKRETGRAQVLKSVGSWGATRTGIVKPLLLD